MDELKINKYKKLINRLIVVVGIVISIVLIKEVFQEIIRYKLFLKIDEVSEVGDIFNYTTSGPKGFMDPYYRHKLYLKIDNKYRYLDTFDTNIDNLSNGEMYIKYVDSSKAYNLYFILRGDNCFFTINKKDGSYVNLNNYLDEHKNDSLSDNEYLGQIIPILCEFLKNNQDDIGLESLFRKIQEFY